MNIPSIASALKANLSVTSCPAALDAVRLERAAWDEYNSMLWDATYWADDTHKLDIEILRCKWRVLHNNLWMARLRWPIAVSNAEYEEDSREA